MRTLIWILSAILAFVLFLGFIGWMGKAPPKASNRPGATERDWVSFPSSNGGFSVLMPTHPNEEERILQAKTGQLKMTGYSVSERTSTGTFAYSVTFSDYPIHPEDGAEFLNLAGAQMANAIGKVRGQRTITLQNFPGREFEIEQEGGKNLVAVRVYFRGSRLYQTLAFVPVSVGFSSNTWRFQDSFRFDTDAVRP